MGVEEDGKFSDSNLFEELGSTILIVVGLFLLILILLVIRVINKNPSPKMKTAIEKVKTKLFWNAFIRSSLQSYLKIAIIAISALTIISQNTMLKTTTAIVNLIVLLVLPVLYGLLMYRKRKEMTLEETNVKYGSLFLGIRHLSIWQAFYSVIFLLRRLIFALIVVILADTPSIVVGFIIALNMTFICYIGQFNPHNTPSSRRIELMNEAFLQTLSYLFITTWFSTGPAFDLVLGWIIIGLVAALLIANIGYIIWLNIKKTYEKMKLTKQKNEFIAKQAKLLKEFEMEHKGDYA